MGLTNARCLNAEHSLSPWGTHCLFPAALDAPRLLPAVLLASQIVQSEARHCCHLVQWAGLPISFSPLALLILSLIGGTALLLTLPSVSQVCHVLPKANFLRVWPIIRLASLLLRVGVFALFLLAGFNLEANVGSSQRHIDIITFLSQAVEQRATLPGPTLGVFTCHMLHHFLHDGNHWFPLCLLHSASNPIDKLPLARAAVIVPSSFLCDLSLRPDISGFWHHVYIAAESCVHTPELPVSPDIHDSCTRAVGVSLNVVLEVIYLSPTHRLNLLTLSQGHTLVARDTGLTQLASSTIRAADLCCGIGGFSIAASAAGCDVALAVDIDPDCLQVYRQHFPHVPCLQENLSSPAVLRALVGVHIVMIGFPCQPYSRMGARRFDQDPRSLVSDIACLLYLLRPLVMVLENVVGFQDAADCNRCLRTMAADIEYHVIKHVHRLEDCTPHQRDRLGLIFLRGDVMAQSPVQACRNLFLNWLAANVSPPTVVHRGVFHDVELACCSQLDEATCASLLAEDASRFPQNRLPAQLRTFMRSYGRNLQWSPPRIVDLCRHPIHGTIHLLPPLAVARSLGFPENFSLPSRLLDAYPMLGNALSPVTAFIWLEAMRRILRSPLSTPVCTLRQLVLDAVPATFASPVTGRALVNLSAQHSLPLPVCIAQEHGLAPDLVAEMSCERLPTTQNTSRFWLWGMFFFWFHFFFKFVFFLLGLLCFWQRRVPLRLSPKRTKFATQWWPFPSQLFPFQLFPTQPFPVLVFYSSGFFPPQFFSRLSLFPSFFFCPSLFFSRSGIVLSQRFSVPAFAVPALCHPGFFRSLPFPVPAFPLPSFFWSQVFLS